MKRILSMRKTGDSTRYIDDCVQRLFLHRQLHIDGKHLDRFLHRLYVEHRMSVTDFTFRRAGDRDVHIKLKRCPYCGSKLDTGGVGMHCHTCDDGAVWCIKCGRVVINTREGWSCIDESCR